MTTFNTLNSFTCRIAPLLPADIQFIALDFPGHGRSSHRWPGMPYTHFEYVADVKKVVTQLGWARFSIIGHSMGANVGSLYAGAFPLEVDKLVLFDFGGPSVQFANKTAEVLARYATKMSEMKTTTPRVYQSLESAAERRQVNNESSSLRKEDAVLLTERGTRLTEKGIIFSHDPTIKGFLSPLLESQSLMMSVLSNSQCAVLLLESTDHKIKSEERKAQRDRMKIIYQNAKYKVWKRIKGGHHFHMENPKQVAQEISEFLALCKSHDQSVQSKL